jgi:4-hydroxybenzoate polyprenyltransferase
VAWLGEQRRLGRTIVLATAAHERFAHPVAQEVGLFHAVYATAHPVNLGSHAKRRELVRLYGEKGYDYVGDAKRDIPVWMGSRFAYSTTRRPVALPDGRHTEVIGGARHGWTWALLRSMRPRQWVKNLLVFVPMVAAHGFDAGTVWRAAVAFAALSFCASAAYLLNDGLDAPQDRRHPTKRHRPIASGHLPLPVALGASAVLLAMAGALCLLLGTSFFATLAIYVVATFAYSLWLKRLMIVDIVVLAVLYSLRVIGGAVATDIVPSIWLLSFSFFAFLSLALLKRHSELTRLQASGGAVAHGRGYEAADAAVVGSMGVNSAFMSTLVLMLYLNSENVLKIYHTPLILIGIVPVLVFWFGRLWMLSYRGRMSEDPILFVTKDTTSLAVLVLCAGIAVAASI